MMRTSLVVQWLRIHTPVQGTGVRSLIWEDSTCLRATKPVWCNSWAVCHNHWSLHTLEPVLCNKRRHCNQKPVHSKEEQSSPQLEKAHLQQLKPSAAKNKQKTQKQKHQWVTSSQVVKITKCYLKSQSLSTLLLNILCDETGNIH